MICMKVANQNISKYRCTDASQLTVRVRVGDVWESDGDVPKNWIRGKHYSHKIAFPMIIQRFRDAAKRKTIRWRGAGQFICNATRAMLRSVVTIGVGNQMGEPENRKVTGQAIHFFFQFWNWLLRNREATKILVARWERARELTGRSGSSMMHCWCHGVPKNRKTTG